MFMIFGMVSMVAAMPVRPDLVQEIKQLPVAQQENLLEIPDWVNRPDPDQKSLRVTSAAAVVILVDFDDHEADPAHTASDFNDLLFSEGIHPTGSMYDYYIETSYDQFTLEGEVTTVWLRMPQVYTYYVDGQRGFGAYPNNAQKMVEDALVAADALIDFSQYDSDSDGFVDAVFVVHSGPGYEDTGDPNNIHSHMSDLRYSPNGPYETGEGVKVGLYSVEPEEHANGDLISIGVFCHEFGHVLGLPDLYDYGYDSGGVGTWCIMASGSWGGDSNSPETPVHFSAWCKKELGWLTPYQITQDMAGLNIVNVEENAAVFQLMDSSGAYFLFENRQKTGFDINLYNSGIIVWHIDESMPNNDHQCTETVCPLHFLVALEQADGDMDLEFDRNRGDDGDSFPGTSDNRNFNTETTPNSWDYNGKPTWVGINNISDSGMAMTADITLAPTSPFMIYVNHEISGDNDGDGIPESGETFNLTVTLTDFGLPVNNISGTLTADTGVDILDGTADYGNFASEEEKNNSASPFQVKVHDEASRGTRVTMTLSLTGDGGFVQDVVFRFIVSPLPLNMEPDWQGILNYSVAGTAADINGDGTPDLLAANVMDQHDLYFNTGTGLPANASWHTTDNAYFSNACLTADLAGDGYPELIFVNVNFNSSSFIQEPGPTTLYSNTNGFPAPVSSWSSMDHLASGGDIGDIDGDGIPDLIIGCVGEVNVAYRGLNTGTFETAPFWSSLDALETSGVALLDIDGDADLDLASATMDGPLVIYYNNGAGLEQSPSWSSTSLPIAYCLAVADMDRDGYPEIALGCYQSPTLLFSNTGGTLGDTPSWQADDPDITGSLAWGDIDGDGYPELISGLVNLDTSSGMPEGLPNKIYYNDAGNLSTYPVWMSDTENPTFKVGLADFDGDTDLDLYTINLAKKPEMFLNTSYTCDEMSVTLWMPSHDFTAGDPCALDAFICNPGSVMPEVPVFVLLQVFDQYWFAPTWTHIDDGIDYYEEDVESGMTRKAIIPEFDWPVIQGSFTGLNFIGAMLNPEMNAILGNPGYWSFGYH